MSNNLNIPTIKNPAVAKAFRILTKYSSVRYSAEAEMGKIRSESKYTNQFKQSEYTRISKAVSDRRTTALRELDSLKREYSQTETTRDILTGTIDKDLREILHSGITLTPEEITTLALQHTGENDALNIRMINDYAISHGMTLHGYTPTAKRIESFNSLCDAVSDIIRKDDLRLSYNPDDADSLFESVDEKIVSLNVDVLRTIPNTIESHITSDKEDQNMVDEARQKDFEAGFLDESERSSDNTDALDHYKWVMNTLKIENPEAVTDAIDAELTLKNGGSLSPYDLRDLAQKQTDKTLGKNILRIANSQLSLPVEFDIEGTDFKKADFYTLQDRSDLKAAQREREESNHAD